MNINAIIEFRVDYISSKRFSFDFKLVEANVEKNKKIIYIINFFICNNSTLKMKD